MMWIPGIILGLALGYWCYTLVGAVAQMLIGPLLGCKITQISFFSIYIMRMDGKLKLCLGEFSWFPETILEARPMSYGKRIAREFVPLVLGIGLEIGLYLWLSSLEGFAWHVCAGTMVILAVLLAVHLGITIKMAANMLGKGKSAEFWRENDRVLELVKQGVHPKDLVFHYNPEEKQLFREAFHRQYDFMRYYKALEEDDRERMAFYIEKMKPCIDMDWSAVQTPLYYEVIYYLAKYEKDPAMTETYANRVFNVMEKDKDVNGRRVYASYLFYSGKDKKLAVQVAKEGLRAADKYAWKGLAYMERNLLEELIYEMEEKKEWI